MPYSSNEELPENIKNVLPEHAQDIYRAAFNNAFDEYKSSEKRRGGESQEETAYKVAWSAVKNKYVKQGNYWIER